MEKARVEAFNRTEKSYCLVVEPRSAIEGLRQHLATKTEDVEITASSIVGDIGINLLTSKTLEDVLSGVAIVVPVNLKKQS